MKPVKNRTAGKMSKPKAKPQATKKQIKDRKVAFRRRTS